MTRLYSLFFALGAAVLPSVSAHGYVGSVSIDGALYAGSMPGHDQGASPIRTVSTIDPVKGADNSNINCGQDAQLAAIDAPAMPGSTVAIQWVGGATGTGNWPHNVGPLMTYMASCGGSCTSFNGSSAEFFKIAELGQEPGSSTWYQASITQGDSYTFNLPDNIAPGSYLIRHEIISLQLAATQGGAEFYPVCIQVQIGGSGSGTPNSTVSFPGAYSDTDPGIYTPNVYNPGFVYEFPGGAVSNLEATANSMTSALTGATFASGSAVAPTVAPTGSASASAILAQSSASTTPSAATTPSTPSSIAPSAASSAPSCKLRPSPVANSTIDRRSHRRMVRRVRHAS